MVSSSSLTVAVMPGMWAQLLDMTATIIKYNTHVCKDGDNDT